MFNNYTAHKKDLEAVEEALGFVLHPKMRFVFSDTSRIEETSTISYDHKYIYMWSLNPTKLTKIPHNLTVPDKWQRGWWAGVVSKQIERYLPNKIKNPIISGGLLTPFIVLQKTKNILDNPYTTKESYFATIIHEFGHIYWNSYKLWWPSNKEKNINLLEQAKKSYTNRATNGKFNIEYPSPIYISEVFAHCTEYYASEIFWPKHKNNFDRFAISQINTMITAEEDKNLNTENSVLEPTQNQHNYSIVVGKLLTTKYPKDWPSLLTKP
jgi:hypothetical protein